MKSAATLGFLLGFSVVLAISAPASGQPTVPTNLSVSCHVDTATVRWQDNSNNELFFGVWRRPPAGVWAQVAEVPAGTEIWSEPPFTLFPGNIYCYTVSAHNIAGQSTAPEVCVPSLEEPPLITPFAGQTLTGISVVFSWGAVANADRYSLRLRSGNFCGGPEVVQVAGTQHTIHNLENGTYSWNVVALSSSGVTNSSISDSNNCATFHFNPPFQDTVSPTIVITQPTTDAMFETPLSEVELKGTASDNVGVTQVTWTNVFTGASGTCNGTNSWSSYAIPLQTGDNYFTVRAHDAANNVGTDDLTVTYSPPPGLATVTLSQITEVTESGAAFGGVVTDVGASNVTLRGVCWNTTGYPNISNPRTANGTGAGVFEGFITGLSAGTTYYVRAYAINAAGTAYSAQSTFTTIGASAIIPTVTITGISNITHVGASSGGTVVAEGGSAVTARGVCWNTGGAPTVESSKTTNGTGLGSFTSSMAGLLDGTTYYVRAYATNAGGTGYSDQLVFTTLPAPRFSLIVTANPSTAGSIAVNPPPPAGGYLSGAIVTLTATPITGFQFGGWSGDLTGTNPTTAIAMYQNRSVTANFGAPPPPVKAWFSGRVTDAATGAGIAQAHVKWGDYAVVADGDGNYTFASLPCATYELRVSKAAYEAWAADYSPTCNQNNSKDIALNRATVKLSVESASEGSGRIRVNGTPQDLPWSGMFPAGTAVTVEAAPNSGWAFDHWDRDGVNYDNGWVQTFAFDVDATITAHYVQAPDFQLPAYRQDNPFWRAGFAPKSANFPDDIVPKLGKSRGNSTWYAIGRLIELGYDRAALDRFAGATPSDFDNVAKGANPSSPVIPWSAAEPRVGCIAQSEAGHVAVVERINSDGSFVVSESSFDVAGGANDYLYRESTRSREAFNVYIYVPVAGAPGAQSPPCGAMGNCGATGFMTLVLSFVGLGVLRRKRV